MKKERFEDINGKGYLEIVHKDKSLIKTPETLEEVIEDIEDCTLPVEPETA